jgi:hypothetical protein
MDDKYETARLQFFEAVRALAASASDIQTRLVDASTSILPIRIDEFDGDPEMKLRFARILDLLGPDLDDIAEVAVENAAHMKDETAIAVARLICDFYYDLAPLDEPSSGPAM